LLALSALAAVAVVLVVRHRPINNLAELVLAVGTPFLSIAVSLFVLAVTVLYRRALLSVLAFCVLTTSLAIQASWYYVGGPVDVGHHGEVRVLSANLRLGRADPSSFVALARSSADVITVSELTPTAVERFTEAGITDTFPHSVLLPTRGAGGIGLWSRFPLTQVRPGEPRDYTMAAARVQLPGVRTDPVISSVHVESPVASNRDTVAEWRIGIAAVKVAMDAFAIGAGSGAVIVAGDFNSTPDMRQFRNLTTNDYRDAAEQSGAGFAPTFPSRSWHPPLLTIDHILTRNAAASVVRTVFIEGSDHRALLATIRVPLDPTAS
jgi:endonuclease/exonuclease/phosphatase (EEP) superfamily protein YafD